MISNLSDFKIAIPSDILVSNNAPLEEVYQLNELPPKYLRMARWFSGHPFFTRTWLRLANPTDHRAGHHYSNIEQLDTGSLLIISILGGSLSFFFSLYLISLMMATLPAIIFAIFFGFLISYKLHTIPRENLEQYRKIVMHSSETVLLELSAVMEITGSIHRAVLAISRDRHPILSHEFTLLFSRMLSGEDPNALLSDYAVQHPETSFGRRLLLFNEHARVGQLAVFEQGENKLLGDSSKYLLEDIATELEASYRTQNTFIENRIILLLNLSSILPLMLSLFIFFYFGSGPAFLILIPLQLILLRILLRNIADDTDFREGQGLRNRLKYIKQDREEYQIFSEFFDFFGKNLRNLSPERSLLKTYSLISLATEWFSNAEKSTREEKNQASITSPNHYFPQTDITQYLLAGSNLQMIFSELHYRVNSQLIRSMLFAIESVLAISVRRASECSLFASIMISKMLKLTIERESMLKSQSFRTIFILTAQAFILGVFSGIFQEMGDLLHIEGIMTNLPFGFLQSTVSSSFFSFLTLVSITLLTSGLVQRELSLFPMKKQILLSVFAFLVGNILITQVI